MGHLKISLNFLTSLWNQMQRIKIFLFCAKNDRACSRSALTLCKKSTGKNCATWKPNVRKKVYILTLLRRSNYDQGQLNIQGVPTFFDNTHAARQEKTFLHYWQKNRNFLRGQNPKTSIGYPDGKKGVYERKNWTCEWVF